jgi:outer membrane protein TolC
MLAVSGVALDPEDLVMELPEVPSPGETPNVQTATAVQSADNALARSRIEAESADLQDAPVLVTSLSFVADYLNDNTVSRNFQEAWEQLEEYDLVLRFEVNVPLYRGDDRRLRRQLAQADLAAARLEQQRQEQETAATASVLRRMIETGQAAVALGERKVAFSRSQADIVKKLYDVGQANEEELRAARIDQLQEEVELWRSRGILFLDSLKLNALLGSPQL